MAIENDRQTGIQEYIIFYHRFQILGNKMIIPENILIRQEGYLRTVRLICRFKITLLYNFGPAIPYILGLSVPERLYFEIFRQSIDSFNTDTVQTDRFFKSFRIVLGTGIHLRRSIH